MPKKVYDILPPKLANSVEDTVKGMGAAKKPKRGRTTKAKTAAKQPSVVLPPPPVAARKVKEKRFPLRELFIGGGVVVLLLGIYLFTTLPHADIQVLPMVEAFQSEQKLVADKNMASASVTDKAIPARFMEEEKEATQQFAATGSASNDGKATGTIRVYNKVSPSTPIVLKEGTHFLSDSGKYFVTLDRITVPAMQGKTAGSISVRVEAEESGADSNIGASKFSVPKLSGTTYYFGVWAESTVAMKGGYAGDVKKVTADDIAKARDAVSKQLLAEAESSLRSKLSEDDVVLDNAIARVIVDASSTVAAGTVTDTFAEKAKVKVSFLVFKKQDLQKYATNIIEKNMREGEKYLPESLDMQYSADTVDMKAGIIKMDLKFTADTYQDINLERVESKLSGKNEDQIRQAVLAEYPGMVSKVNVDFWPFWVSKAPGNKDKVDINLSFK